MNAKPFAHEVALLAELPQREAKVCERLSELPVDAAVELLHDLIQLAEEADEDAQLALLACVALPKFMPVLGYDKLADLYVTADDLGYEDVKGLMTTSQVRKRAPKESRVENEFVEKTLGERKALARSSRDRDLLDRLLFDHNPAVIRELLRNPRIIERDVVKLASMRPTTPVVLYEVLRHPKWSGEYRVKKALVFNPYLPVNDATSLLRLLLKQDLREVAKAGELHESVTRAARELLERREHGGDLV
ncbi:MAG TPA: hypothetical protein VMV18_04255 [bacterium]|nr:hypothetical protein [bacterium]